MLLLVDVESGADGTEASLMTATVWSALSALGSCVTRPQATTVPPCDLFFSTNLCRKLCLTMYTEPLWQTFSISSCLLFIDVFSSMGYCCPFWGCRLSINSQNISFFLWYWCVILLLDDVDVECDADASHWAHAFQLVHVSLWQVFLNKSLLADNNLHNITLRVALNWLQNVSHWIMSNTQPQTVI